ncbi:MAG: hypothetical protein K2Z81_00555 [Cyanobacteria bacterium]|nr:hypothetical protein [Cyanobacteriota bacterium]
MRTLFFDQYEFDDVDVNQTLDISSAPKRECPDLRSFSQPAHQQVCQGSAAWIPFAGQFEGKDEVLFNLMYFAEVEVAQPRYSQVLILSQDQNQVHVIFDLPERFISYLWQKQTTD